VVLSQKEQEISLRNAIIAAAESDGSACNLEMTHDQGQSSLPLCMGSDFEVQEKGKMGQACISGDPELLQENSSPLHPSEFEQNVATKVDKNIDPRETMYSHDESLAYPTQDAMEEGVLLESQRGSFRIQMVGQHVSPTFMASNDDGDMSAPVQGSQNIDDAETPSNLSNSTDELETTIPDIKQKHIS
jgi:hypothetical protein